MTEATETFNAPAADRAPTTAEEEAAERAAADIDVERVGDHVEEAAELGAGVRGEGEIDGVHPD